MIQRIYEPQIRAYLGTAPLFYLVVALKFLKSLSCGADGDAVDSDARVSLALRPNAIATLELCGANRKVDVRLTGKGNSNVHGARPVHQIILMIDQ